MKIIRIVLGQIILFFDAVMPGKIEVNRTPENQKTVDAETSHMKLYQFKACPFCLKVRRAARKLNLKIETRDAMKDETSRNELLQGGGRIKVPCLRIETEGKTTWMYESSDIVAYLQQRFAA